MKILIVDNHTKHLAELESSISTMVEIVTKENFDPKTAENYDLIVFSGGFGVPTVLNHPEEYKNEIEFIKNTNKAVLGICLGSEIITAAFGGELQELPHRERGEIKLEISDPELAQTLHSHTVTVFESHTIGIKTLPPDFTICASSDHGPEIIRHKTRPIIGIQFHPEVMNGKEIFEWVRRVIVRV